MTVSAIVYSKPTGHMSRDSETSRKSSHQLSLEQISGQGDSRVKMSPWRERALELGLEAESRDYFLSLLASWGSVSLELLSSRTSQAFFPATADETSESLFERWPNSGMVWDGVYLTAKTSASPNPDEEYSLLDVIETGEVPPRYFLSPNAAEGILRRVEQAGRRLFPPLRNALEILAKDQSSSD